MDVLIESLQRCPDQQVLTDAYQKRQFVLISGPSGSGKSTLAMTLRSQVEMEGGYFLLGKFNQFQSPSPYEAMVLAMTDFIQQLEKRGKLDEMRSRLNASIHFEMNALTNTIPALKALMEDQNQIVPEGGKAMIRFMFAFRTLLQKISFLENPIVVLIDDLQWSDDCSLQLLFSILSDPSSCGICLVTTFQIDIEKESSFPNLFENLDRKDIKYYHIELEDITGQVANAWIQNSSEQSSAKIKMLPSSLLENSNGSVLLILERIGIHQSVLLSSQGNNSEFEIHDTNRDMMQLSLRQILQNRMNRLSDAMKDILITAAFLQSTVLNVELLSRIETNSLAEFLIVALENKIVLLEGGKYVWAHDEIEAAAYFLMDSQKREKTHLTIGRKLWKCLEVEEVKANIFLVLNQYKRAENIITKQDERNAVGLMCLWAGESAIRSSSFHAAKLYLEFGVDLLHKNNSHPDYDLSISILSLAAESAFCQSEFDKAETMSLQVLDIVSCLQDGIRMHVLHVCILASRGNLVDSRRYCLSILKRLGQRFPNKAKKWDIAIAYLKIKRKLRGKSNEALLRLQMMTDTDLLAVMQILNVMIVSVYTTDPLFSPLIAIRMVELSLNHGLNSISSIGFAMYSVLSCSLENDIEPGYRYGQLSLRLLENFNCIEYVPRVYSAFYGFSAIWRNDFSASLTHLQYAHQIALETSDLEFAIVNANIFGYIAFNSGVHLSVCDHQIGCFITSLQSNNPALNLSTLFTLRPLNQLIRNLMGKNTSHITALTGDLISEEHAISKLRDAKNQNLLHWLHYQISLLCYIFGNYERAATEIKKAQPVISFALASVEVSFVIMLDGLIHLTPGKHRSFATARRRVATLQRTARKAPHHLLTCLNFLEAELAGYLGSYDDAVAKFMVAAALAKESNSMINLGLIYERFGDFYSRHGKFDYSQECYKNAVTAFHDVGAAAKVAQILRLHPE